jgi:serine acetyltransferase
VNLPVVIERDVWVGARVTILKGVRIAEGSVVGAGSVVTRSLPPYVVAYGNPCRAQRARFEAHDLRRHLTNTGSQYSADDVVRRLEEAGVKVLPGHVGRCSDV